ncbi:MAG: hypothetical protein KAS47_07935 [Candidatus Heimdallarchaeota archaeon]|nr:hypothetical protein [Candidatus Heimdallarchaeota archaeon]MCK4973111.1 hypothetical protein [Candidatus Heimdallarchaeota archaeon]
MSVTKNNLNTAFSSNLNSMSDEEKCGDYEVYLENDWWVVKNTKENKIIGKFISKDAALDKVAVFLQDEKGRMETESVC